MLTEGAKALPVSSRVQRAALLGLLQGAKPALLGEAKTLISKYTTLYTLLDLVTRRTTLVYVTLVL